MIADNSRGAPLTTDRVTAENPGEEIPRDGTPRKRQTDVGRAQLIDVWAHGYGVVSLSIGIRQCCRPTIVVPSCAFCTGPQIPSGKPYVPSCVERRYRAHARAVADEATA